MTDLEITRLCAMAMGYGEFAWQKGGILTGSDLPIGMPSGRISYDPLHDNAQCFALVKRFQLYIGGWTGNGTVTASIEGRMLTSSTDLNRAICECVAKMQAAK